MKIIVDAMGGDNAPSEIVMGAIDASKELSVGIILVGRCEDILKVMLDHNITEIPAGIEISNASEVISMGENPASAIREKKDSSLVVGLNLLNDGIGEAFVSAGSTGALLSGATLIVKRIKGIRRAALAPVVPTAKGGALLIDCGANIECTGEYLLQFAYMGSYYSKNVLGVSNPKVGLLNIGSEETKGGELQRRAYALLKNANSANRINFVGNVESRDVTFGVCDVVVADGYSGNIMLKTIEGVGLFFVDIIKGVFKKNLFTKLSALMVKDGLVEFKKLLDYAETGGAPFIGINKTIIKAHGSSNAIAMKNAIRQAKLYASSGIIEKIEKNIEYMQTDTV